MNLDEREMLPDLDNWGTSVKEEKSPDMVEEMEMQTEKVEITVDQSPIKPELAQKPAKKSKGDFFSLQSLLALAGDILEIEVQRNHSKLPLRRNRLYNQPGEW